MRAGQLRRNQDTHTRSCSNHFPHPDCQPNLHKDKNIFTHADSDADLYTDPDVLRGMYIDPHLDSLDHNHDLAHIHPNLDSNRDAKFYEHRH